MIVGALTTCVVVRPVIRACGPIHTASTSASAAAPPLARTPETGRHERSRCARDHTGRAISSRGVPRTIVVSEAYVVTEPPAFGATEAVRVEQAPLEK